MYGMNKFTVLDGLASPAEGRASLGYMIPIPAVNPAACFPQAKAPPKPNRWAWG